jgi:hypothetical protein
MHKFCGKAVEKRPSSPAKVLSCLHIERTAQELVRTVITVFSASYYLIEKTDVVALSLDYSRIEAAPDARPEG